MADGFIFFLRPRQEISQLGNPRFSDARPAKAGLAAFLHGKTPCFSDPFPVQFIATALFFNF